MPPRLIAIGAFVLAAVFTVRALFVIPRYPGTPDTVPGASTFGPPQDGYGQPSGFGAP